MFQTRLNLLTYKRQTLEIKWVVVNFKDVLPIRVEHAKNQISEQWSTLTPNKGLCKNPKQFLKSMFFHFHCVDLQKLLREINKIHRWTMNKETEVQPRQQTSNLMMICFFNPSCCFYLYLIWSSATNFFCHNYFSTVLWSNTVRGVSWILEAKFTQSKKPKGWKCLCKNIFFFWSCQYSPWQKSILRCQVYIFVLFEG